MYTMLRDAHYYGGVARRINQRDRRDANGHEFVTAPFVGVYNP
jgi:hypothetical protein